MFSSGQAGVSAGAADIRQSYIDYLNLNGQCMARLKELPGPFSHSSFLRLFVVDLANVGGIEVGLGVARHVITLSEQSEDQLESDAVAYAERLRPQAKKIILQRVSNIRHVMKSEAPDQWADWTVAGECRDPDWSRFIAKHTI